MRAGLLDGAVDVFVALIMGRPARKLDRELISTEADWT
jgi:hypothetical protein